MPEPKNDKVVIQGKRVTVSGIPWGSSPGKVEITLISATDNKEPINVVKALIGCTFNKVCSDIPGACIVLQMVLVVAMSSILGYLFVTQELMK